MKNNIFIHLKFTFKVSFWVQTFSKITLAFVILLVGVNGAGKTTTIGKLASLYKSINKKVVLACGDTFRAAAIEQLSQWGEKINRRDRVGEKRDRMDRVGIEKK